MTQPKSNSSGEDVILQWNRVVQETIRTPGLQPPTIFPVRSFAMMHTEMFDAVNSIDGSYTPYLTDVPGTRNASLQAAAAQAAHDVLAVLYSTRKAVFDMELANSLDGMEENRMGQGIESERLSRRNCWRLVPTTAGPQRRRLIFCR